MAKKKASKRKVRVLVEKKCMQTRNLREKFCMYALQTLGLWKGFYTVF